MHVCEGLIAMAICYEVFKSNILLKIPTNFYIAGCIGSCILSDDLAFGGFFIVKEEYRCKGVGRLLWDRRLQYIEGIFNVYVWSRTFMICV